MPTEGNPVPAPNATAAGATTTAASYLEAGRAVPAGHSWDWIVRGWRIFKRQAGIWILLALVLGLIIVLLSFVPILGQIAVTLLMPVFIGGLMIGCRKVENGEEIELADLFAGFRRNTGTLVLVALIGVALMIAVIVPAMLLTGASAVLGALAGGSPEAAGAGAMIGFLLIIALAIPVNMALWFAPALVVLQDQPAVRAITQSFRACLKNIIPFLLYGVILFVLAIFATIPFGLGWLALGPVIVGSVYGAYQDIFLDT